MTVSHASALLQALLVSLAALACTRTASDTGSESHFVTCAIDLDCPADPEDCERGPCAQVAPAVCEFGHCTVAGARVLADGNASQRSTSSFSRGLTLESRLDAPTEGLWGVAFREADFELVSERGFDHVRIPVRFDAYLSDQAPYEVDPWIFSRLDGVVDWSLAENLPIVIAWSRFETLQERDVAQRQRFVAGWRAVADHYADAAPQVAFELLYNPETVVADYDLLMADGLDAIRESNPDRLVMVRVLDETSQVPGGDPRLWLSFGYGGPDAFVFQGQEWAGPQFATTGIVYPGPPSEPVVPEALAGDDATLAEWFSDYNELPSETNPCGPSHFQRQIEVIQDFEATTGYPAYVGNWGSRDGSDEPSRLSWTADARSALDAHGIRWAYSENGNDSKLFDATERSWVEPLTGVVLGE